VAPESFADGFGFPLAQQAVIDKDASNLRSYRADQERCRHGGIDPTRQTTDDAVVANGFLQLRHGLVDERLQLPGAAAAAHVVQEIAKDAVAARSVAHLWVELQ